jgi:hypothetical protein
LLKAVSCADKAKGLYGRRNDLVEVIGKSNETIEKSLSIGVENSPSLSDHYLKLIEGIGESRAGGVVENSRTGCEGISIFDERL